MQNQIEREDHRYDVLTFRASIYYNKYIVIPADFIRRTIIGQTDVRDLFPCLVTYFMKL